MEVTRASAASRYKAVIMLLMVLLVLKELLEGGYQRQLAGFVLSFSGKALWLASSALKRIFLHITHEHVYGRSVMSC